MKMDIDTYINKIKSEMIESCSERLVLFISTTANLKNPDVFFASSKVSQNIFVAHVILRSGLFFDQLIDGFNDLVDYFLIDPEVKGDYSNLLSDAEKRIPRDRLKIIKPNDFTVNSAMVLISELLYSRGKKSVSILGLGNIGFKLLIMLLESGIDCSIYTRNGEKEASVLGVYNHFIRGTGKFTFFKNLPECLDQSEVVVTCTPGVANINQEAISGIKEEKIFLDIGNGSFTTEAVELLFAVGCKIFVLDSRPGLWGQLEVMSRVESRLKSLGARNVNESLRLVTVGVMGRRGDIIVSSLEEPFYAIGVCDGKGGVMPNNKARKKLEVFNEWKDKR